MVMSLVLLNLAGGDCVDDLKILEADEGFCKIMRKSEMYGLKRKERRALDRMWRKEKKRSVPSPSAAFRYLSKFHDTKLQPVIAVLLAAFFGKEVLHKVSFKTALFYRYGFTSLLMFLFVLFTQKFDQFAIATNTNWIFFIVISLTTGSGAIMLYYYGLKRINAKVSTICELCFPISTILFDYLFNHQVLSPVQ